MTPLTEALGQILADARPCTSTESLPLLDAPGRVLACDVSAAHAVPPWDNSAMDGYALRLADLERPGTVLPVSQRIAAGSVPEPLAPGSAARIFTGAPVPEGADVVVMQEEVTAVGAGIICSSERRRRGDNIRRWGQDIRPGEVVLSQGRRLLPQDLGVLASVGVTEVAVRPRLTVGLLSTGAELQARGRPLNPGRIYNSNAATLVGLLQAMQCSWIDYGVVADDRRLTESALQRAAAECDLIVSTGGVSVGEEDHVREALQALGELKLWKLAIKPGKPMAYGRVGDVPFFGLPGNPAAAFITFGLVVKPYLYAVQGATGAAYTVVSARADFDRPQPGRREEYLRGNLARNGAGELVAGIHANQSSGLLSVLSRSNCLVVIPAGVSCQRGDVVDVILLSDWLH